MFQLDGACEAFFPEEVTFHNNLKKCWASEVWKGNVLDIWGKQIVTLWAEAALSPVSCLVCCLCQPPPSAARRCTCFSHAACPSRPRVPCWHVPSHFQEQPTTLLTSSSTISFPSPLGQTLKEESLPLPAANPLVTPQKPGIALDNSLHKDLFGAISGIGNVSCSVCFSLVSF